MPHGGGLTYEDPTMDSLMQLTRFQDRLTYLYLEKGHIEQDAKSIAYVTEKKRVPVPAADFSLPLPPRLPRR